MSEADNRIADFFRHLAAKQKPLGKEFEEVLHANLWDLYVHEPATSVPAPNHQGARTSEKDQQNQDPK